ncbi:tRNA (adenosine(37)-N6)-threonylcarbamoyltransferase complex ATPase subunit type 1 TsaE [bacterium]|nr:tRNA (adenosine(37)-N6)-threonylcarbamoyltransferase complex ATPase subunit type 1 TsaE [bacterium]
MKKRTKKEFITNSFSQTKKLGEAFAKEILLLTQKRQRGVVLALKGDLGGGKTTFLQGFAKGLGIKEKILSPTFVIIKKYKLPTTHYPLSTKLFYHIDCYRIENKKEILHLGYKKFVADPQNIIAIEWAEKIKDIIPKDAIWIYFEFLDKNKRRIIINYQLSIINNQ